MAANKKADVDIGDKARNIKCKFETGELFKDDTKHHYDIEDKAVFDYGIINLKLFEYLNISFFQCYFLFLLGIGKQSRSIFQEIDAKAVQSPLTPPPSTPKRATNQVSPVWPPPSKNKV